jgi:hypothetical protein
VADLIITRANCLPAFDSERDPVANPWDGASPDIYLGSPGQLEYDVMENGNVATVFVCVHNKGLTNAYANVRLFIQFIPTGDIWDTEWQPMRDKPPGDPTGRDQVIGLTVPQRGQATANATWHINADSRPIPRKGWHQHSKYGRRIFKGISRWAIRAVVECPEDGSPDNNSSVQFVSIASRHEIYIPWPAQPAKGTKHPKEKHPKKKRPKKKAPKKQTHAKRLLSPKLCATAQLSIAGVPR